MANSFWIVALFVTLVAMLGSAMSVFSYFHRNTIRGEVFWDRFPYYGAVMFLVYPVILLLLRFVFIKELENVHSGWHWLSLLGIMSSVLFYITSVFKKNRRVSMWINEYKQCAEWANQHGFRTRGNATRTKTRIGLFFGWDILMYQTVDSVGYYFTCQYDLIRTSAGYKKSWRYRLDTSPPNTKNRLGEITTDMKPSEFLGSVQFFDRFAGRSDEMDEFLDQIRSKQDSDAKLLESLDDNSVWFNDNCSFGIKP